MSLRTTFVLVVSLAIAGSAAAKDVQIGSAAIVLPPPQGFCALTDQQPADARVIKGIGGLLALKGLDLLAISADCSQLDAWRHRQAVIA